MSNIYGTSRKRIVGETWFWVAMGFALILVVVFAVGITRWVTADARGRLQAREQILSGPARIAAYNHFFDLCAQVQSDEATMRALNDELKGAPPEIRKNQIAVTLTALVAGRAEKINQYNADARKDYTIGQFRNLALPFTLDINQKETTC